MHDNLRNHSNQEVAEQAQRKPEARPVMSILQCLQGVTLKVHLIVKVHLMERLHGNLALAMILDPVMLAMEMEVMLHGLSRVLGLLVLARRDRRGDGPKGHEDGE